MTTGDWMLVGQIAGAFGVRGEMKMLPLTDFPERIPTLDTLYLGPQHAPHHLERARAHQSHILIKLEGIDTPEQVAALRSTDVFVPKEDAAPLPEGHFYLADAIGIKVRLTTGEDLGVVTDVMRTGSNEVFVVRGPRGELLIPVTREAVPELDVPGRIAVVQPWALGDEE